MELIVIEGACDGIGKTTQFNLLCNHLMQDGNTIIKHHFPSYHTDQGKCVENYLAGDYGNVNELSPYFINGLYAMDRAVTWKTELKEALSSDDIVLLDRYTTSSIIYQSAAIDDKNEKNKFIDYIMDFEYNRLGIPKPNHVIFLTASYDVVKKIRDARKENDGVSNDLYERDDAFMRKIYDNAIYVANYLNWDIIECSEGNLMKSIHDIHEDVYKKVRSRIK